MDPDLVPEAPPAPRTWVLVLVVVAVAALYYWETLSRLRDTLVPTVIRRAAAAATPEPLAATPEPLAATPAPEPPGDGFARAYAATFDPGAAADACGAVRRLFYARRLRRRAVGDARMRLPNDLAAERRLVRRAEREDHSMLARIEEAKERLGCRGLHPGPLGYPLRAQDPATGRPRVRALGDEVV